MGLYSHGQGLAVTSDNVFWQRNSMNWKGYLMAALAAAFYGTNPIFSVPVYSYGMNASSILLFRYLLGFPFLGLLVFLRHERLILFKREIMPVAALGVLMACSSLALYECYHFMNAGIASTLLFMYPLLTALIMTAVFREKFHPVTGISLLVMTAGLYLLMQPGAGTGFNLTGFVLIFISSLTYAVYLVMIKVCKNINALNPLQSLFWQLLFGSSVFFVSCIFENGIILPHTIFEWLNLSALAIFPTVLSLLFTIRAIVIIGPTPTALFGALEPVTAVIASYFVLGETVSAIEICGALLIIISTMLAMLINAGKN